MARRGVETMFAGLARRYDLLNRLISMGLDRRWRRAATALLRERPHDRILDLAAGTGDQALDLFSLSPPPARVVAADAVPEMLALGRAKAEQTPHAAALSWEVADATALPYGDRTFAAVTISFGIRNVTDRPAALREMHRVLRPGGTAVILEVIVPQNRLLRPFWYAWCRVVLPVLGGLLAGDAAAYRYLHRSVEAFPPAAEFLGMMAAAGFSDTAATPLTGSIAMLFTGRRPNNTGGTR